MDKKDFKEEKYKKKKRELKNVSNKFLYSFIFIFFAGYMIFFTSTLWLPKSYVGVNVTPVGEIISKNKRDITIYRWVYSPADKTMEIIIEMKNNSIDDIKSYKWQGRDKDGYINTKVVASEGDFTIIQMRGIKKNWTEVSLTITADMDNIPSNEENKKFEPIVLYMNDKTADVVDHVPLLTMNDYKKIAYESIIESFRKEMNDINNNTADLKVDIENANLKISEIKAREAYQTEAEKEETKNLINELNTKIESFNKEIDSNEEKIEEIKEKIELKQSLLNKLD